MIDDTDPNNDPWHRPPPPPVTPPPGPTTPPGPTPPATNDQGLQLQPGWSNIQAATYLLQNGMKGAQVTDYLKSHGYQDNGLYYPDSNIYGFGNAYVGQDSNGSWYTHQREGGSGGPADFSGNGINPDYLAPWTGHAPTGPEVPTFQSPGEFTQPTADSMLSDPSYLFRLDQGRGTVENSAAAKGLLNSGGNLIDIANYGQKAASQEYGSIWDRAFGVWQSKWSNALNKYRADESSSNDSYQRAWQQYSDARDTWYRNQSEPWSKLYQAASLGASAAR